METVPADRPRFAGQVLAFDTSGSWVMAALSGGFRRALPRYEEMARGQAERLMPLLEEMLAEADLLWSDLAGLGVGIGPGNFTGTRIAVAAARGLALALKIPVVGVSQFDMALAGLGFPGRVMVSLPAPQDRAYVQTFLYHRPLGPPAVIVPGETVHALQEPGLGVFGHRSAEIALGLGALDYSPTVPDRNRDLPATLADLAKNRLTEDRNPPRPAPIYVRPADAAPPRDPPPRILP